MPNVPETADQFYARDDDLLEAWHFMNISGSPNETPGGRNGFFYLSIYTKAKQNSCVVTVESCCLGFPTCLRAYSKKTVLIVAVGGGTVSERRG